MGNLKDTMPLLPIVYVEDSPNDADLFARSLRQMRPDCHLYHFRDGFAAQQFLATFETGDPLEVIVVDINLPGISGLELIRWIREQRGLEKAPVVALSGAAVFENDQQAQKAGADAFLRKPDDYNGWIDLVYQLDDCLSAGCGKG